MNLEKTKQLSSLRKQRGTCFKNFVWTICNEKWSRILLIFDEIKMLTFLQILIFQTTFLLSFDKKFQKKKKKFFTCEFIVASYFNLGNIKMKKNSIKKPLKKQKIFAKNEEKIGTKNELFWSSKNTFFLFKFCAKNWTKNGSKIDPQIFIILCWILW